MSQSPTLIDSVTERRLDGVANLISVTPYCWLTTRSENGGVSARPMGRISAHPQKTNWMISFLTDGRSRKTAEMRQSDHVTLVFDDAPRDQYAALSGVVAIRDDADERAHRWKADFDKYFPAQLDRSNAVFVDISIDRIELWIKGLTPEPFGLRPTVLLRSGDGNWRSQPESDV